MQESKTGRKSKRSWLIIAISVFALFFLIVFGIKLLNLNRYVFRGPQTVVQLITDTGLKNEKGRVNVLLLGIGGQGHDGPYLSDTMILASVEKEGKDVILISIPRDLWSPPLESKINAAYAFGIEKDKDGLGLASKTVQELFGIPVHYAARIDFRGFEKAIDHVGGIDVEVENSFSDYRYPLKGQEDNTCGIEIEERENPETKIKEIYFKDATGEATLLTEFNDPFTCRYETLVFKKGPAHLDGKTALKFVRSRHGNNNEGTDFARSARQEKIIRAFRQQAVSKETLFNPKTIIDLLKTFESSIDTDVKNEEITLFAKLAQKASGAPIRRIILDSGREESVLEIGEPQNYGGQFVLVPKGGWEELQRYIQTQILTPSASPSPTPTP